MFVHTSYICKYITTYVHTYIYRCILTYIKYIPTFSIIAYALLWQTSSFCSFFARYCNPSIILKKLGGCCLLVKVYYGCQNLNRVGAHFLSKAKDASFTIYIKTLIIKGFNRWRCAQVGKVNTTWLNPLARVYKSFYKSMSCNIIINMCSRPFTPCNVALFIKF